MDWLRRCPRDSQGCVLELREDEKALKNEYLGVKANGLVEAFEQTMSKAKSAECIGFKDPILHLLCKQQLLLINSNRFGDVAHLHQNIAHVAQRPELGLHNKST